jgi:pimeloyl-ACP methyl ester carboxylesterase
LTYRSHFIAAPDGLKLHVRDYGDPLSSRVPVLCLAGLTRNAQDFGPLAEALSARGHRVIAPDYRGRGLSERDPDPARYDIPVELEDVFAVCAALDIGAAAIVGTSRGGLLAMAMGAAKPEFLRAAVLNDVGPILEVEGLRRIAAYVGKIKPPANWDEAIATIKTIQADAFPALDDADWQALAEGSFVEKHGALVSSYDPALMEGLAKLDLSKPLPPLWVYFDAIAHVPVLALRGENSPLLSQDTFEAMAARHPKFTPLLVKGQGHAPLLRDALSIDAITRFIGGL